MSANSAIAVSIWRGVCAALMLARISGLLVGVAGGSYGGPTRPPRGPLSAEQEVQVRADTKKALDYIATRRVVVAA